MNERHEQLLGLATAAHGNAEVFGVESERRYVEFEANRPKNIGQQQSSGIALRIINKNGRIGFSSTSDIDKIDRLVDRTSALSEYGAEAKFQFPGASDYLDVESVDDSAANLTDEEMLELCHFAIDPILTEFSDVLCSADFSRGSAHQRLVNSTGLDAERRHSTCSFYMGVELIRDTDMLSIWDGIVSASPIVEPDLDRIVARLITKLRNSQNIVDAPIGKDIPILFSPVGFNSTFLPPLLSGFNGKNVSTGSSPLIDRWGEKKLDERISIADDPLQPMTPVTRPMDDEGMPSQRINFISNGVIGEPFLDLQTAGEIGKSSNGCGMRSVATTPSPSTSYIVMAGGDIHNDHMFRSIKQGILVEQLLGAGQGNELGGDFRANLSLGFLIENGEVVGRVKDTMISGNVYEALNEIESISQSPEVVWGTRELPWVCTRGIEVATSS